MNKKSNINIELLRIVCAFLVIQTHVLNRHLVVNGSEIRDKVCILNTVSIVAVPCFLMITGYFTRKDQDWLHKIKKTITAIVLPTLLIAVISTIIFPWVCHISSLKESIYNANYSAILPAILAWRIETLPGCSHLWYITAYCRLILVFPLLSYLCDEDRNARLARRGLYLLYVIAVFYNDLRQVYQQMPNLYFYNIIDSRIMFFLLGYEFNGVCDKFKMGGAMTVFGCLMMFVMTRWVAAETGRFSDFFFHYQTVPCMIASFGSFAFFLSLRLERLPQKLVDCIRFLGKQTWLVYLVHLIPLNFLRSLPNGNRPGLRYLLLLTLMTAVISFAVAIILNFLYDKLKKLLSVLTSL